MSAPVTISEITESEEPSQKSNCLHLDSFKTSRSEIIGKKHIHPIEDDLGQLLEACDPRIPFRRPTSSHPKGPDLLRKSALKMPIGVGMYHTPGIGISESVTLKQALRKLCISQASEMAASKRMSKPIGVSLSSEAGTIKRLYASVVLQANECGQNGKGKLLEISLVPEKSAPKLSDIVAKSSNTLTEESCNKALSSSSRISPTTTAKTVKPKIRDVISSASAECEKKSPVGSLAQRKEKTKTESSDSVSKTRSVSRKPGASPRRVKQALKTSSSSAGEGNQDLSSASGNSKRSNRAVRVVTTPNRSRPGGRKGSPSAANGVSTHTANHSGNEKPCAKTPNTTPANCNPVVTTSTKNRVFSRSREKGECSQSSKSSIGDYSSSTSISEESHQSGSSGIGMRPHMSNDVRWAAIRQLEVQHGSIGLKNFKLLKRLGCGDIGTVYLAELIGLECLFALKVMDNEFLISRKKMIRAKTEREILQMLDHPFLPTLYTHFTTDNLSCLVMEYCPGGDLHVLRQKQLGRSFSEPAARFYVAEVLLALEYLHMLGVVYRDLKPENILVREDGHIMLSDFDLSLRCSVNPTLVRSSSVGAAETAARASGFCAESSCIHPLCVQPSWAQVSCFTPRLASPNVAKNKKLKSDLSSQVRPLPQLVVEPTEARSNSFVGTHEYLAPEIIKGEGHGSSVDWWTFGIFLYELLFGRTPFKGPGNEETLANVVSQSLKFPETSAVSFHARDLIRGLLVKEPENRLGSVRGAAEIKQHPFFTGLNWALIRCATPPEIPQPYEFAVPATTPALPKKKEGKCMEFRSNGEGLEFEIF